MPLHLIMLTVHSHLTIHWLDNADDALACQVDHAFMPYFVWNSKVDKIIIHIRSVCQIDFVQNNYQMS